MNKIAKNTTLWGKWLLIFASLVLCVGVGTTQTFAATLNTTNNNFTMLDVSGGFIGGTNDVTFTWDGTLKTSVAVSGQVSNATISSPCSFFGHTWHAHDVAIYGPGTYTIYSACPAGSPGCLTVDPSHPPITFTVGAGQMGGHMLFLWNGNDNIDVVEVWETGAFGPSSLWTTACGSNLANKVWDLMSTDWGSDDGSGGVQQVPDGINGAPMVDGPFTGSNANFNLMGNPCSSDPLGGNCNDNNPCTTDFCNITDNTHGTCVNTLITGCDIQCLGKADGTACDDNNACTPGADHCLSQVCHGTPLNCNDNNACTTDSCDTATGTCLHVNVTNGTTCDDNNANTINDVCTDGVCAGTLVSANGICSPAPTLVDPTDGQGGLGTTMELRWTKCVDPDGDAIKYHITYCITPGAVGCPSVVDVADAGRKDSKSVFYASGAGLLMIGMTFIGGLRGRKKIIALLIVVTMLAGGAFISCKNTKNANQGAALGINEMNFMVSGLTPSTTYYWKVEADDGKTGGLVSSLTQSFTTQ